MPGWPTVDRADDQQLVEALRHADTDAPARLYDAYAERLHDYACSLTGDRDSAADAVHDALVTAQGRTDQLKESARLRAWLYALTRFQSVAKTPRTPGTPPPVLDDPEDPELAELVHEALGELSKGEREVLELSLRHGLTPSEVGAVLGLTSRQAATRLGRARDHLENAAAAVVLARTGRAHCPDLSAMVDSWEGPLTPILRRRLSGHIGGCEVCTEGRHRHVSASRLLDLVPVAFPPISLRRRMVETCTSPERDQTRTLITERGDSFDRTGFPVIVERRSRRRPRRLAPVFTVGACVLAATGAMIVMNGESEPAALRIVPPASARASEPALTLTDPSADPLTDPLADPSAEPELQNDAEEGPEPTEQPSRTAQPPQSRPAARPAQTPVARPSTTRPTPTPTRTRAAAPAARLSVTCPGSVAGAGTVRLAARNATITWSAGASDGLDVFPSGGSIKAGQSASVWVTVNDPGSPGAGTVTISSNGGGGSCALSWNGQGGHDPEPTDDPPASPDSTETPAPGVASSTTTHEVQDD
ncbi:sigma-70 family RNA polymerase sigma factor [Nonomuraea africana]|uniref:sigma-70 family RNA polymerase sigma factor n=1 Tax=Nonomuraea africana TaxID=46171 RepID=UPI0033EA9251